MRELDDAMKQASDESINDQVQKNIQRIRDINKQIVELTQKKEEIESRMRKEVNERDLKELQDQHSKLIKQYEEIIREKIDIFTEMISNLNVITDSNSTAVQNEEILAQKKLNIEICERDIYQKQRVAINHERDIDRLLEKIIEDENQITEKKGKVAALENEMNEVENELKEFKADNIAKDEELAEMENNIQTLLDDKARQELEEQERIRKEKEAVANIPIVVTKYKAVKGDRVDELMAFYLHKYDIEVPTQRLGEGNYMFGSRKIFSKIMNDKLVVRVGGGYMLIDEFLQTYGMQEMDKINALSDKGLGSSGMSGMRSPNRAVAMKSPKGRMAASRQSPNAQSRTSGMQGKY
jgi:hypothetical protein